MTRERKNRGRRKKKERLSNSGSRTSIGNLHFRGLSARLKSGDAAAKAQSHHRRAKHVTAKENTVGGEVKFPMYLSYE